MLTLRDRARNKRHRGKQIDSIETMDGRRLRVMKYRMPALEYESSSCGPKHLKIIDSEHLVQLLWACSVDVPSWRATLQVMEPGLPWDIETEFQAGGNWQGFAGERLSGLVYRDTAEGLLPVLLRVPFVEDHRRQLFLEAWSTPEGRERMARYARFIPQPRPSEREDHALRNMMVRRFGIELIPHIPANPSSAYRTLHDFCIRTAGVIKDAPRQRMRTDAEYEHDVIQQGRTSRREGGCSGCSS